MRKTRVFLMLWRFVIFFCERRFKESKALFKNVRGFISGT
jgi:hypothetical protein